MGKLANLYVTVGANVASFERAMASVKKGTEDAKARFENMEWALTKVGHGMQSVGRAMTRYVTLPILGATALAVRAFAQQEDAEMSLAAALRNNGDAVDALMPTYTAFSSQMQKTTIYSDELILSQMALARNMGISAGNLEVATKAAIGLAATYRMDLGTSMMLVAKASQGQTQMLSRYGIVLDESMTPQQKFNRLLEIGTKGMSLAEAETKTLSGQMKQLWNQADDTAESFGAALVPALKDAMNAASGLLEKFNALSPSTKKLLVEGGLIAAAFGPAISALGSFTIVLANIPSAIGTVKSALGVLGGIALALKGTFAALVATWVGLPVVVAAAGVAVGAFISKITGLDNAIASAIMRLSGLSSAMADFDAEQEKDRSKREEYLERKRKMVEMIKAGSTNEEIQRDTKFTDLMINNHRRLLSEEQRARATESDMSQQAQEDMEKEKSQWTGIVDVWKRAMQAAQKRSVEAKAAMNPSKDTAAPGFTPIGQLTVPNAFSTAFPNNALEDAVGRKTNWAARMGVGGLSYPNQYSTEFPMPEMPTGEPAKWNVAKGFVSRFGTDFAPPTYKTGGMVETLGETGLGGLTVDNRFNTELLTEIKTTNQILRENIGRVK